jgi:hypothetical protein
LYPRKDGADFEISTILKPLEAFKDQLVVVSNLSRAETSANHAVSSGGWLTGARPKRTDGPDFRIGTSIDQIVAQKIGQDTTFPSIEVATEDFSGLLGACDPGYSCAYMNTLNWASPTTPLPMEINPRVMFERMFGGGSTAEGAAGAHELQPEYSRFRRQRPQRPSVRARRQRSGTAQRVSRSRAGD